MCDGATLVPCLLTLLRLTLTKKNWTVINYKCTNMYLAVIKIEWSVNRFIVGPMVKHTDCQSKNLFGHTYIHKRILPSFPPMIFLFDKLVARDAFRYCTSHQHGTVFFLWPDE